MYCLECANIILCNMLLAAYCYLPFNQLAVTSPFSVLMCPSVTVCGLYQSSSQQVLVLYCLYISVSNMDLVQFYDRYSYFLTFPCVSSVVVKLCLLNVNLKYYNDPAHYHAIKHFNLASSQCYTALFILCPVQHNISYSNSHC